MQHMMPVVFFAHTGAPVAADSQTEKLTTLTAKGTCWDFREVSHCIRNINASYLEVGRRQKELLGS